MTRDQETQSGLATPSIKEYSTYAVDSPGSPAHEDTFTADIDGLRKLALSKVDPLYRVLDAMEVRHQKASRTCALPGPRECIICHGELLWAAPHRSCMHHSYTRVYPFLLSCCMPRRVGTTPDPLLHLCARTSLAELFQVQCDMDVKRSTALQPTDKSALCEYMSLQVSRSVEGKLSPGWARIFWSEAEQFGGAQAPDVLCALSSAAGDDTATILAHHPYIVDGRFSTADLLDLLPPQMHAAALQSKLQACKTSGAPALHIRLEETSNPAKDSERFCTMAHHISLALPGSAVHALSIDIACASRTDAVIAATGDLVCSLRAKQHDCSLQLRVAASLPSMVRPAAWQSKEGNAEAREVCRQYHTQLSGLMRCSAPILVDLEIVNDQTEGSISLLLAEPETFTRLQRLQAALQSPANCDACCDALGSNQSVTALLCDCHAPTNANRHRCAGPRMRCTRGLCSMSGPTCAPPQNHMRWTCVISAPANWRCTRNLRVATPGIVTRAVCHAGELLCQ